jgi:hypothetical protein
MAKFEVGVGMTKFEVEFEMMILEVGVVRG